MRRRDFLAAGMTGAVAAGMGGCAGVAVKQELAPHAFDRTSRKPAGTMPTGMLGKTGVRVSKFGFGSHMRRDIVPFTKEREWMIREAHELGITLFDVYDKEQECFQYEPMGKYLKPVININSGLNVDATIGGMYYPYHVYENVEAYCNPAMNDAERSVLAKIRRQAKVVAEFHLPPHYRFLNQWAPDQPDDPDLARVE